MIADSATFQDRGYGMTSKTPRACGRAPMVDHARTSMGSRRRELQVIRRQIKAGTYDVDARLTVILDRMLEDLRVPGQQ